MKLKILLITDHFRPKTGIASLRTAAITKYLDPDKFDVFVFTEAGDDEYSAKIQRVSTRHWLRRRDFYWSTSPLKHKLKVVYNRLVRLLSVDQNPGFYWNGKAPLIKWFADEKFDIVISTYSSLASLRLGYFLKRENLNFHWVCDFRDEMSKNQDGNFWDRLRLRYWEKKIVAHADMVTSVSEPILKHFAAFNPRIPAVEVRNGYDFEPVRESKKKSNMLNLVYAGALYNYINLNGFFSGWMALPSDLRSRVRLKVVGASQRPSIPQALTPFVEIHDKVSYEQIPDLLASADALLLVTPRSRRRGVYTGKIFDYLAVNRPILALINTEDCAGQLIREVDAGFTIENSDAQGIAWALKTLLTDEDSSRFSNRRWDLIERHHRREQVKTLGDSLARLIGASRSLKQSDMEIAGITPPTSY